MAKMFRNLMAQPQRLVNTGIDALTPLTEEEILLQRFIQKATQKYYSDLLHDPLVREISALDAAARARFVTAAARHLLAQHRPSYVTKWNFLRVMEAQLRHKLPFTTGELITLSALAVREFPALSAAVVRALEFSAVRSVGDPPVRDPWLRNHISLLGNKLVAQSSTTARQQAQRLRTLLGESSCWLTFTAGEAWTDVARNSIGDHPAWAALIHHCAQAKGSVPTASWLKRGTALVEAIGAAVFKDALLTWWPHVATPYEFCTTTGRALTPVQRWTIKDLNADILKGLVWLASQYADEAVSAALRELCLTTYRKIPIVGLRCVRVANACVWTLGALPGTLGVEQLALLKLKVKTGGARNMIEKALNSAAKRLDLPATEIEELCVPTYGLTEVGLRRVPLGDYTAELRVMGTHDTTLQWVTPDGKTQASVPKAIKDTHAATVKELQQVAKAVEKLLPAQRDRLENLYLEQARWPLATWQARYLDHPVIGTLARRLIWQFHFTPEHTASAIWHEGQFVQANGAPLAGLTDATEVSLWHPLNGSASEVLAWREWLAAHEIRQPFKQAHREIYVLTAAEEATSVYSNRFAAHILKQHQFNALCAQRAWKNRLRLMVDDRVPPAQRLLPKWGLRAEFWTEGIGTDYGRDTNETGTYLYVTTDQVRFYPLAAPQNYAQIGTGSYAMQRAAQAEAAVCVPLPLAQIPPLVFSEVMRDVDLFVGVASVANDPNWLDGGAETRHVDYWRGYSFGELTASATTRKAVLQALIPRLSIGARCSFSERFLIVRGELRTYKIHLGSGNILMEPNDQYLCIVAARDSSARRTQERLYLPFEGDNVLSLILSKAFMLADDRRITDATITRQLR